MQTHSITDMSTWENGGFDGNKYASRAGVSEDSFHIKGSNFYYPNGAPAPDPGGVDACDSDPTRPAQADFDAVAGETATNAEICRVLDYVVKKLGL